MEYEAGIEADGILPPAASIAEPIKKSKKQTPQDSIDDFWASFTSKFPGKAQRVLPSNDYARTKAANSPKGVVHGQAAVKSYEQASSECVVAVEKIAKECRRVNLKYRDPHFDIEFDLKRQQRDCLDGLVFRGNELYKPKSVKRIPYIFEDPTFYQEGATASDVRQGFNGDCWFLSALCALGNKKNLIDKVCVKRDEQVGVYGFVFYRDGEWVQTIIDDKLYLIASDWHESVAEDKKTFLQTNRLDAEEKYRKSCQTGSNALFFAQCSSENETWLPLLEKAYAKAHGDYSAIDGGFTGEAVEDLTGGVTTELFTTDILDTEKFWTDEIMRVNKEFLFGCGTGSFDNWQGADSADRKGVVGLHAYSIMDAQEIKGERLVRVRNPWGEGEWRGAWSDGSEQWTSEWMQLLDHKFGDDGMFWISYKDLLRNYQSFNRTRLFGPEWHITQQWTTVNVPWSADYNDTKFNINLTKRSPVVVVLSQLDDRYFRGLEGQYTFSLHFRLEEEGQHDYIVRSHGNYRMCRSVSTDIELDAGKYSVLMKISGKRWSIDPTPEDIIRDNCKNRPDKLIQIGLAYDLAHAKGQIKESEKEKAEREEREAKRKAAAKMKEREEFREAKYKQWQLGVKQRARDKRQAKRKEEHDRKKFVAAPLLESGEGQITAEVNAIKNENGVSIADANGITEADQVEEPAVAINPEPQLCKAEADVTGLPTPEPDNQPSERKETNGVPAQSKIAEEQNAEQFHNALLAIPSVQIPGTGGSTASAPPPSTIAAIDDWQYDSDASFNSSIDTTLDLPEEEPPDQPEEVSPATDDDEENAVFANDPWNAMCVVGLRVYSQDSELSVEIVRPKHEDDEGDTPLDLDDVSKGASGEVAADA